MNSSDMLFRTAGYWERLKASARASSLNQRAGVLEDCITNQHTDQLEQISTRHPFSLTNSGH